MKPVPVLFHLGPLTIHTYGVGLAVTFVFALWYFTRRLREAGLRTDWVDGMFGWVVVAAIVGARVVHVLANVGAYTSDPWTVLAVWQGGLSSFGGLLFAVPVGFWQTHRRCPELRRLLAADLVAPVLVAAWGVGRLLGPQLMIRGGGHPTTAWYGLYYAGQVGKRLPVPLFQAAMCGAIFVILLAVERRIRGRAGYGGLLISLAAGLWGLSRFIDEHFWLAYPGHLGDVLVQAVALVMAVIGLGAAAWVLLHARGGEPAVAAEAGGPATVDSVDAGLPVARLD